MNLLPGLKNVIACVTTCSEWRIIEVDFGFSWNSGNKDV